LSALFIFITIALTVYGQLSLKWHMDRAGQMPVEMIPAAIFIVKQLLSPLVISSFGSAFLASLTWMAALTKMPLSTAYPFMSLAFPLVAILSVPLFHEQMTLMKAGGTALILAGLFLLSR